jgi:hypothetical protein
MRAVKLIWIWGLAVFFALGYLGVCSGGGASKDSGLLP